MPAMAQAGCRRLDLCANDSDGNNAAPRGNTVWLIVVYLVLMITGDILDYLIGLVVERVWPQASLPVFLGLYFLFLWIAWLIAVKLTEPKVKTP